jgi:hypothetical protein
MDGLQNHVRKKLIIWNPSAFRCGLYWKTTINLNKTRKENPKPENVELGEDRASYSGKTG